MLQVTRCATPTKDDLISIIKRLQSNPEKTTEKRNALLGLEAFMRDVSPTDQPLWYKETQKGIRTAIAESSSSSSPPKPANTDTANKGAEALTHFRDAAQLLASNCMDTKKTSYGQILRDAMTAAQQGLESNPEMPTNSEYDRVMYINDRMVQSEEMARTAQRIADRLGYLITTITSADISSDIAKIRISNSASNSARNSGGSDRDDADKSRLHEDEVTELLKFMADATEFQAKARELAGYIASEKWDVFKTVAAGLPRYKNWPLISQTDGLLFLEKWIYYPELENRRPEAVFDDDDEAEAGSNE